MITSIMQPTFLPSPIYLSLIYQSDNFVFLDNVQFSKQSWQQRNKIMSQQSASWLTIPIKKSKFNKINEIKIMKNDRNFKKILNIIKFSYSKSPFFEKYFKQLEKILLNNQEKLSDLNVDLIKWLCECFNIKSNFYFSSKLAPTYNLDKVLYLIEICKILNTSIYLSPLGSKEYLEKNKIFFTNNKLIIRYNNFDLKNFEKKSFNPSAIDLLFNEGGNNGRKKIISSINKFYE